MKFSKVILSISFVAMALTSCDKMKDFGDTNVNPNATTVPNTAALLSNVLAGISGRASQQNPGYFCQYFSETQYPGVSLYANAQFDMDGVYAGAMYDCKNIINVNTDPATAGLATVNGSNANQIAIARILLDYYYWTLTDTWGDIPYSQALTISNTQPKYDRQEDIYKSVIADLTQVVDQFDNGAPIKGDLAFNGSIPKWRKLANSIRVLMALRLSKKFPGTNDYAAQQVLAASTHSAGLITTNADNFEVAYPGGNFRSPWFSIYDSRDDLGESLQMVNLLGTLADSRQLAFGSSTNGVPYGRDRASFMNNWFAANSTSYSKVLAPQFRTAASTVAIVHASAVLLALAEAGERNWIINTPADVYKDAITASFNQWGITDAAVINTYLANSLVAYGANNLDKIALQRYIALYPDGLQGWAEWRRTGIPALTPALDATSSSKAIPRRFKYGVNDYNTNPASVGEAADRIPLPVPTPAGAVAGDTQDGRVWWDQ